MDETSSIGERVRSWRHRRRLSQTELGRRVGVSQATVSNVEGNRVALDLDTAWRLADALDVPTLVLLLGRELGSSPNAELDAELRWYGLPLAAGRMPWFARPAEQVIVEALRAGDPRVVDRLAALFFLHPRLRAPLLAAHAEVSGVRQRLGWLVAVARHFTEYEHEGRAEPATGALRDRRLEAWLEEARPSLAWDGIGHPAADRASLPPFSRRWKIDYDRRPADLVAAILQTLDRFRGWS